MGKHQLKLNVLTNDISFDVTIDRAPDVTGGEGYLYHLPNLRIGDCMMKLYKTEEKAERIRKKILYLMQHQPPKTDWRIRFCWPIGVVYDEKEDKFRGYVMLTAFENSRDLTILSAYYPGRTIAEMFPDDREWHDKFDLGTDRGLRNRLVVLKNWFLAVNALHATGKYVLGDIKPENILVTPKGYISVIDIDSCQVYDNGKLLYECSAKTPDYFPPEAYDIVQMHKPLDYNCDSFAMGCCAYSILVGCHPYVNIRLLGPYADERYCTIAARIKAHLYYRGNRSQYTERIEGIDLHSNLSRLSMEMSNLFDRTFANSYHRPTMGEWIPVITNTLNNMRWI